MKSSILATFLSLAAASSAVAVPDEAFTSAKRTDGIEVILCNDFHGGKPCEMHIVYPGQCSESLNAVLWRFESEYSQGSHNIGNVDANLYKYVSSVKIAQPNEYCTFYNEKNCQGENVCIYYPGDVDLAVGDNFDNEVVSYQCAFDD